MRGVETYERIRRAHYIEGHGIRWIAKRFGHDRRLVRKALAGAEPRQYRRDEPPESNLDPHRPWIDQILIGDRVAPRKQRHTAKRIYDRLVEEREYAGGYSTVRRYVARRRLELGLGAPEVYVPLDHPLGRDAEVDWGYAIVRIGGEIWAANVLEVRACASGALFVRAYPVQQQEAFLDGMRRAFEFFGGVYHRLVFDNLRAAVRKILEGRKRQEQDGFVAFRSHYLFESFFCMAGEPGAHEKGGVEGGVGYARRNWMVPVPDFPTWEAFNDHLLEKCRQELLRTAQGKTEPIGVLLDRERPILLSLPERPFDCCRHLFLTADSHARIRVDGIHYSVPADMAYRPLQAKVYASEIHVVHEDCVVARHVRRFSTREQVLDPLHYLPVLTKKPHLVDFGLPFAAWRLPPVFGDLRRRLDAAGPGGLRDYVRVLQAIPRCDVHTVASAINEALRSDSQRPLVETVLARLAARGIAAADPAPRRLARPVLSIAAPDVIQYDLFLGKEPRHGNESAAEGASQAAASAHDVA